jgi:acyl-CoA thioester hydrolase
MSRSQFAFFHPLRVRYSEVDSQGYVFDANRVNYSQTGLTEYFRDFDFDHATEASGADFHTVRVVLDI